jgi:hypothetical protein
LAIASGAPPTRWAQGLSPSHERQSTAEFFDDFAWEGGGNEILSSAEFFEAFDDAPEPPSPPTLRGYGDGGRQGET